MMKRSCCSKASTEGSRGFDRGEGSEKGAHRICGTGSASERPFAKGSRSSGDGEVMDFFFFLSKLLMTPSRPGDSWVASVALLIGTRGARKSAPDDFRLEDLEAGDSFPIMLK